MSKPIYTKLKFITISGSIGSGKSVLANKIADLLYSEIHKTYFQNLLYLQENIRFTNVTQLMIDDIPVGLKESELTEKVLKIFPNIETVIITKTI